MKKETKETIVWIKKILDLAPHTTENYELKNRALELLDSLPLLERQLAYGGFIPDVNKKPCKAGDKVLYKLIGPKGETPLLNGILKFDGYSFYIEDAGKSSIHFVGSYSYFEKVE